MSRPQVLLSAAIIIAFIVRTSTAYTRIVALLVVASAAHVQLITSHYRHWFVVTHFRAPHDHV